MTKWKVLVSDKISDQGIYLLEKKCEVVFDPEISANDLIKEIGNYHALVVRSRTKVTKAVICAGENLKIIGRAGVGVDNIDLKAAKAHDIRVVNSPQATTTAVAEHTIGLLLSMMRNIPQGHASLKQGLWEKSQLKGSELSGKVIGVIGLGNIGARVTKICTAFGMKVLGYDPFMTDEQISERMATPTNFKDLLNRSDIITIHLRYSEDSHHLIDTAAISQMKSGVKIVCTARGGIIDESAIVPALKTGHIENIVLDVFSKEPPGQTELIMHPRMIGTPHIAAQTVEAQIRAASDIAEEVINGLDGNPLRWQVA
jgi:D-3-phosphoglycerate dehydrogenase / 2-oxoglutarate reductase